jgi:hypothetical protein
VVPSKIWPDSSSAVSMNAGRIFLSGDMVASGRLTNVCDGCFSGRPRGDEPLPRRQRCSGLSLMRCSPVDDSRSLGNMMSWAKVGNIFVEGGDPAGCDEYAT